MTNKTELKGRWKGMKGKIRHEFPIPTEGDLLFEEDRKNEMLDKLQIMLGKTKEEMNQIIESPGAGPVY